MTVFNFVFKRFFRRPSNVVFLCIIPLASVLLPVGEFYEWLPLPIGFQYYGVLLLFIAARLAGIIMEDRENKTLMRIGVSPISHFKYLWQNLLAYSLILMGINLVVVLAGVVVHGEILVSPLLLYMLFSNFSFTAIGLSLAWYSLFRNKEAAFSVLGGVYIIMAMLGGVMWPIVIMPDILQRFAMLLPTYWLMEGLLLIVRGGSLGDMLLPWSILLMFSMAFIILGSRRRIA